MLIVISVLVGAILASFANVVCSRGPRAWRLVDAGDRPANLAYPPSQCEACGRKIAPLELIPVASYLSLRGRCGGCGEAIGVRHISVEILGAILGGVLAAQFGLSVELLAAGVLAFALLCLGVIDAETGYLPDALTIPLLIAGLLFSFWPVHPTPVLSFAGALVGGGGLWLIAFLYRRLRGREGLGGGDVKLVAAGGAWCGAFALPFILLAASLAGLAYAGFLMALGHKESSLGAELRFGPFLAAAIGLVYIVGPPLMVA